MVSHNEALLSTPVSQVPNPYDPDKNIMDTTLYVLGEPLYEESNCRDDRQWQEQRNSERNSSQSRYDYGVEPESYASRPIKAESPTSVAETYSSNQAGYDQAETTESTYDQALNHTLWDHPYLRDHYSNQNQHASAAQESSAAQGYQDHHHHQYYDSQHRQSQLHESQHYQDQHYPMQEHVDQYPQNQEYLVHQYPEYHRDYDPSHGQYPYTPHQRDYHQYGEQNENQQYDRQFISQAYSPYPAVLHGQATAYTQVHAAVPSENSASPRTRELASVPMSNTPDFNFVDSSIRPAAVSLSEPQAYVSPYGHVSPRGNYHPRCQADARDRESPGPDAPGPGSERSSPVAPQVSPSIPVPAVQPQEPSSEKDFHKSWRPAPKNTTKCDVCNGRAFAQTVHQRCTRCTAVICRTCVEQGHIRRFKYHTQMDVFDFNWGRMRPSWRMVRRNKANARSNQADAADDADQPTTSTSFLPSSDVANNIAPSTPARQAIPASCYYVDLSDEEDDHDEQEDMGPPKNSPSSDGASSDGASSGDREYKPATNEGFFSEPGPSREQPSESALGESETSTTPGFVKSLGSVGLANSRPVRTSSLNTYERMRAQPYQRYIGQPGPATGDDAMAPHRHVVYDSKMVTYTLSPQNNYTGPRVSFVKADHTMPLLDPHTRHDSLDCQNQRSRFANGTSLYQNLNGSPSTQQSTFASKQNAKLKFEKDKKMMLFFDLNASDIHRRTFIRNQNTAQGGFAKEKNLLTEVTNFWFSHNSAQAFRATDEVEAFALLRAHVNIAIRRLNIESHEKLDQWLDTTEKDVQERSGRFVPNAMKPQDPKTNVLHEDLNCCVTPEYILAANALLSMRFS
ncbi:hypothetical protein CkaCkLH20_03234 [Colletotrichum karsti]|uniref:B box-type domain-containing protein n=1 Tax=Colletotrichum karsti TaxID=1095194 RepID=A0A9P6LNA4_9PEZI|nr:uncharacterized protein CkaCkLH20_03234 [Colletotrichum karsti]KAF9879001.1 hypothetical protein CkaCkLH20_03234 [Colletotrichum karsti]